MWVAVLVLVMPLVEVHVEYYDGSRGQPRQDEAKEAN